jgi:hypothetical protein
MFIMTKPPSPDEPKTSLARPWVWHCTEASIAAGQISLLAALETVFAVGLHGRLAYRFEWHWLTLSGLNARKARRGLLGKGRDLRDRRIKCWRRRAICAMC